jgi:tRNA1Val (adenine37-N6)-methyltransferase
MKLGTDGVLLGAWARGGGEILDIGSGSGIIALMMAQRNATAQVCGVEIDADAAGQSRENVAQSPFARRVKIFVGSFQEYRPARPLDAIVSNPPFFLSGESAPDHRRAAARHAPAGFFADFFAFARRWLLPEGEVSIVVPADAVETISADAYLRGFLLSRRVMVRSVPRRPAERCLLAFTLHRRFPVEMAEHCLLKADGSRSEWYECLTRDFYLQKAPSIYSPIGPQKKEPPSVPPKKEPPSVPPKGGKPSSAIEAPPSLPEKGGEATR